MVYQLGQPPKLVIIHDHLILRYLRWYFLNTLGLLDAFGTERTSVPPVPGPRRDQWETWELSFVHPFQVASKVMGKHQEMMALLKCIVHL